jgi:dTMP kinase
VSARLIAFEGADASGKSTQARRLGQRLDVEVTFQFGATEIGAAIRRILLDPANDELDDRAEALLIIADKAQHVAEIVGPALAAGRTVVSDRFTASALAYQGYGRGLDLDVLAATMAFATGGLVPDLTVLLDVDVAVARERLGHRIDRIEGAGAAFHERVRRGYLELAAADPDRWLVIDAAGSVDEVGARVDAAVDAWLAAHP